MEKGGDIFVTGRGGGREAISGAGALLRFVVVSTAVDAGLGTLSASVFLVVFVFVRERSMAVVVPALSA